MSQHTASPEGPFQGPPLAPLLIEIEQRPDGVTLVRPYGDSDLATSHVLGQTLEDLRQRAPVASRTVVDLDTLEFMDVSTLRVLDYAARDFAAAGSGFAVAATRPIYRRLLALGRLASLLDEAEQPPVADASPA